jgi:hypothetical protein
MKVITPFWITPIHQVEGKPEVKFELRPLDQRAYLSLKSEMLMKRGRVQVSPDGMLEAFTYGLKNWQGLETPFTEDAKREVVSGLADANWALWMEEIAGALFRRAVLGEPELKNS